MSAGGGATTWGLATGRGEGDGRPAGVDATGVGRVVGAVVVGGGLGRAAIVVGGTTGGVVGERRKKYQAAPPRSATAAKAPPMSGSRLGAGGLRAPLAAAGGCAFCPNCGAHAAPRPGPAPFGGSAWCGVEELVEGGQVLAAGA